MTALYLLLGLALVGGLFYALTQITARHQRVNAELTRLERLAGEVSLNAEAILEQVDERIDRLNDLVEQVEVRLAARLQAEATTAASAPVPAADPALASAPVEAPMAPASPAPFPAASVETRSDSPVVTEPGIPSILRYQEVRAAVFALADQGKDAGQISQTLEIPRGEVLLMLNLRRRKVTA